MFVKDWSEVTPEFLHRVYPEMARRFPGDRSVLPYLRRSHWADRINGLRARELAKRNLTDTADRRRCWHVRTVKRLLDYAPG